MSGPAGGSASTPSTPGRAPRPRWAGRAAVAAAPWVGMGMAMPTEKPKDFRGAFRRLLGRAAPRTTSHPSRRGRRVPEHRRPGLRPEGLGNGINQLMKRPGRQGARPVHAGRERRMAQAVAILNQAHSPLADLVAGTSAVPGVGHRFRCPWNDPARLGGALPGGHVLLVGGLVRHGRWWRSETVYRLRRRGRSEARPTAPEVLRHPCPR